MERWADAKLRAVGRHQLTDRLAAAKQLAILKVAEHGMQ